MSFGTVLKEENESEWRSVRQTVPLASVGKRPVIKCFCVHKGVDKMAGVRCGS